MEFVNRQDDRNRKRMIQIVSMIFMGVLVFLTFFSNTLQSLTLPKVRTEALANGSLMFTVEGSGMLQPITEERLTNPAGWSVRKIVVNEGDLVKKGQRLIEYDSKAAQRELDNEIVNLKKMNIELENLHDQFIQSTWEEDELGIRSTERAIESLKLDLEMQERKINQLRDDLRSGQELTAPFDGIVTQLNAIEGMASSGEADVVITNNSQGYRLDIPADSALLNQLGIMVGAKAEVEIHTVQEQQRRIIEGTITEMKDAEPRIESTSEFGEVADLTRTVPRTLLRIKVIDPELKGGEQAWINIEKRSRLEGLVVSGEAIHRDRDGLFIYTIDEQRGPLGNEFVARKVHVQSTERNDNLTVIQSDRLYEGDLVILESSEPLQDGNRVRLQ
ncbi:efflux RND transporter periplasmic adaptor subunit [Paenibacillus sp. FSL M8-0334]|uniref:RND transporter n=1 Tax=Paenibacillus campinasensis TaxID=66347 RepID=A0ABW9T5J4_9BACL|nr:efflux RND transporter periplasmic adaptor subunit [Paenibacillus campinasensis]MUG66426.1 RND transporter [Paenibacillus campinasensis]